jgi:NAD-dependent deacetylase
VEAVLEQQIDLAAEILSASNHTIALVGAGLSKESGIPTCRGGDGLWDKHGEPPMDGYQRFLADPAAWWAARIAEQEQPERSGWMQALDDARPNAGHLAMAELERLGFLKHIITQNIDNLHQLAGSEAITEIHGNRTKMRCIECNRRWPRQEFASEEIPPRCPDCRGIVKSDTVMFGEPIPRDALVSCHEQAEAADAVLLVGTSAVVYPAAEFPLIAYRRGARLIEVNPQGTPLSDVCSAVLRGPSGEALPALVERLRR